MFISNGRIWVAKFWWLSALMYAIVTPYQDRASNSAHIIPWVGVGKGGLL
jgi:hypothetical protein